MNKSMYTGLYLYCINNYWLREESLAFSSDPAWKTS